MATLDDIDSTQVKAGSVDLLIGIAGPVNEEELRARAAVALGSNPAIASLRVTVAFPTPGPIDAQGTGGGASQGAPQFLAYPLASQATPALPWLATPIAYRAIASLAAETGARACVVVAPDLAALNNSAIDALVSPLLNGKAQLTMPVYPAGKYDGLLNSGLLYPLTRALYGRQVRYPVAFDFGVAGAMISRLAADQHRGQAQAIVWPGIEGALADASIAQVCLSAQHDTHSEGVDLTTALGRLAGSVFEDAERNAAAWQRARGSHSIAIAGVPSAAVGDGNDVDVRPLIESFHLGLRNLQEVWGLVLPPVTLLELKKLSRLAPEQFRMPDALWARIVYDFALAHRLRTISRSHLLGALTPLYLGWVASYVAEVRELDAYAAEQRIERLAAVYEECKPYFVSRWRWPDRFNP